MNAFEIIILCIVMIFVILFLLPFLLVSSVISTGLGLCNECQGSSPDLSWLNFTFGWESWFNGSWFNGTFGFDNIESDFNKTINNLW